MYILIQALHAVLFRIKHNDFHITLKNRLYLHGMTTMCDFRFTQHRLKV